MENTEEKNVEGLVHQMNTINSSFTSLKVITITAVAAVAVTALGTFFLFSQKLSELTSKIYVIEQGGAAYTALAQDAAVNKGDEIRDHVKRFHQMMFNLAPDEHMIERSVNAALEYGDKSIYNYYNDVQEKNYYKRLISSHSFQQIDITDIEINLERYPYTVKTTAFIYVERETNIQQRMFVSICTISNTVRTPNNIHGLLIGNFEVLQDKIVDTREK